MNERELLRLKEKIDSAKSKVSELKGQKKHILQTLQTEHKCKTVEEAEDKIEKLGVEAKRLQKKIDALSNELEEKYPQLFLDEN